MIIDQRHRFAFVHVPKTAGTSVSLALKALPGNRTALARAGAKHETAAVPEGFRPDMVTR